jgi:hypothetical protein
MHNIHLPFALPFLDDLIACRHYSSWPLKGGGVCFQISIQNSKHVLVILALPSPAPIRTDVYVPI